MENKRPDDSKAKTNSDCSEQDYDQFIKYRMLLMQTKAEQSRLYDKHLLTLASGALALSLVFLEDIVPSGRSCIMWLLYISWILLIISIVVTLSSYQTAVTAWRKEIKRWDDKYCSKGKGEEILEPLKSTLLTRKLNIASLIAFAGGLVSLCIFAVLNL